MRRRSSPYWLLATNTSRLDFFAKKSIDWSRVIPEQATGMSSRIGIQLQSFTIQIVKTLEMMTGLVGFPHDFKRPMVWRSRLFFETGRTAAWPRARTTIA